VLFLYNVGSARGQGGRQYVGLGLPDDNPSEQDPFNSGQSNLRLSLLAVLITFTGGVDMVVSGRYSRGSVLCYISLDAIHATKKDLGAIHTPDQ
jgi:hypothetical protein